MFAIDVHGALMGQLALEGEQKSAIGMYIYLAYLNWEFSYALFLRLHLATANQSITKYSFFNLQIRF